MFHGSIIEGKKGPYYFWEKQWGTMDSEKYDRFILSNIEQFFHEHVLDGYIFQ